MVVVYAITSFHSCSKPMTPGNVMFLQLLEPPIPPCFSVLAIGSG